MNLILASQSRSRADLLKGAGLDMTCVPSGLDEEPIKSLGLSVEETALKLSYAKAALVSKDYPEALVIGADQMLSLGTGRLDKAVDLEDAFLKLKQLRAQTHGLHSGVSVVQNGRELWSHCETAQLTMRDFSEPFLKEYIAEKGSELLETVGCYRLESTGVQLFSKIEGDYFTILGLPLLALLAFLRSQDILDQ